MPPPQPGDDSLLAAIDSTSADRDFDRLSLIRRSRDLGASWAVIGRTQGKPGKVAKRDAKRLKARTQRAWYLQQNQEG